MHFGTVAIKIESINPILCLVYNITEHYTNFNHWYCLSQHKGSQGNILGDVLEEYFMYRSKLPIGLKWSYSEVLVTKFVIIEWTLW